MRAVLWLLDLEIILPVVLAATLVHSG